MEDELEQIVSQQYTTNPGTTKDPYSNKGVTSTIDKFIRERGYNIDNINRIMDVIAQHESRGDYSAIQETKTGTGKGKGGFQFEEGEALGGKTALNRAANLIKQTGGSIDDPQFANIKKGSLGLSVNMNEFTKEEQRALFIADKIYGESADAFNKLTKNRERPLTREEVFNFWKPHHKGTTDIGWDEEKKRFMERTSDFELPKDVSEKSQSVEDIRKLDDPYIKPRVSDTTSKYYE